MSFRVVPVEIFGSNGYLKQSVLFFRKEFSKLKFVFHLLKSTFGTGFSLKGCFLLKGTNFCKWLSQFRNEIYVSWIFFHYLASKPWTDGDYIMFYVYLSTVWLKRTWWPNPAKAVGIPPNNLLTIIFCWWSYSNFWVSNGAEFLLRSPKNATNQV